ncbi:hypothetical protein POL25_35980 [Nannocystis sp. bb15-2]|uniref:Uncharacterized protein n=1 Tax=Nannocystis bainbridge TaxID=2995303 RepID=A0ABT5EAA3_9BACT|nr:hypothetical protein [Nannocystis bainbridge]
MSPETGRLDSGGRVAVSSCHAPSLADPLRRVCGLRRRVGWDRERGRDRDRDEHDDRQRGTDERGGAGHDDDDFDLVVDLDELDRDDLDELDRDDHGAGDEQR